MYLSLDFLKEAKIALKTRSPMPRYSFCDKRSPRNIDEKMSAKRSEVLVDEQEKKKMWRMFLCRKKKGCLECK